MLRMVSYWYKKNMQIAAAIALVSILTILPVSTTELSIGRGVCPVDSTIISKKVLHKCIVAAKNEITQQYKDEYMSAKVKGKKCKPFAVRSIINNVTKEHNIPADCVTVSAISK